MRTVGLTIKENNLAPATDPDPMHNGAAGAASEAAPANPPAGLESAPEVPIKKPKAGGKK